MAVCQFCSNHSENKITLNQSNWFRWHLPSDQLTAFFSERLAQGIKIMRGLNRNFNSQTTPPSPPWENRRHLTIFCAWGLGNLIRKGLREGGDLTFAGVWWGKLNRKFQVIFVFGSSKLEWYLLKSRGCLNINDFRLQRCRLVIQ